MMILAILKKHNNNNNNNNNKIIILVINKMKFNFKINIILTPKLKISKRMIII